MGLYDWLLFVHVLSAFVVVGALVVLWGLVAGTRAEPAFDGAAARSIGKGAGIAVGAGLVATFVSGIWLSVEVEGYGLLDGWILASLILWAFSGFAGDRAGKAFNRGPEGRRTWIRLQAVNSFVVLLILALMIWKPGA